MRYHRVTIQTRNGEREIMVGRRRKPGKRKPSGDLIQERTPKTPEAIKAFQAQIGATMPHRQGLPPHLAGLQEAENLFGRMFLAKMITLGQFDAGKEYRRRVLAYRMVIEAPRATPKALPMDGLGGGRGSPLISDDEAKRRKAQHDEAFETLHESGRRNLLAVNSVVIRDEPIGWREVKNLVCGLSVLERKLLLTRPGKSVSGGK
jgi:hypothetical protein